MTHIIPVTEARKKLLNIVDDVDRRFSRVDLTKNGRVKASIVSPDYLDSLEETVYSLEHSLKDIKEAELEISQGGYVTLEEFNETINASRQASHRRKSK